MFARLIAIVAFLCFASAAQAQNNWSAAGTACVPTGATVAHYQTAASVAAVRHLGSETGTLVFTCGLQRFNSGTSTYALKMSYRDSSGTNASASVTAKIYRMALGSYTPTLMATVTSDSSVATANSTLASSDFNHTFDFETNLYFVQVTLTRAASETVQFHAVWLDGASL